ncbi:ComF family protein [Hahella ganghwensis]|uniref:ComF family protein n=1 Tax=Hahella ganghwensis TaxID=286420 RepID=UPI0003A2CE3C|nr:ComF family protein [Hahella ganghwensis]
MEDMIKRLNKLSTFIRLKVDSHLPRHCLLCLDTGQTTSICSACRDDFPSTVNGCEICGQSIKTQLYSTQRNQICGHCLTRPPAFSKAVFAFDYRFPLPSIIRQLKYHERGYWAKPLAQAAYSHFQQAFSQLNQAVLVPVPMHSSQYYSRRDNHAQLLAKHLALYSGFPVNTKLVAKTRATPRQAELTAKMRRRNVRNSFAINMTPPESPIIIIDDVMTTGSTIDAIAVQLLKAGATEVFGFSVARRSVE